ARRLGRARSSHRLRARSRSTRPRQNHRPAGSHRACDPHAAFGGRAEATPPLHPRYHRLVGASIAVGIIRKPHGIRGEASVELWTNSADRFRKLKAVTLVSPDESETRDLRIESSRAHADRVLIK